MKPIPGEEIGQVGGASREDIDMAVEAARSALGDPRWASLRFHERARILYRFADLIEKHIDHLAST